MGIPGIMNDRTPIATQFSRYGCMDDLTTEPALIWKVRGSLICLAFSFFDILDMVVCITGHWQSTGRLMQELNVLTVLCTLMSDS